MRLFFSGEIFFWCNMFARWEQIQCEGKFLFGSRLGTRENQLSVFSPAAFFCADGSWVERIGFGGHSIREVLQ